MTEVEFEEKVNKIIKEEINNDALFMNNDFNTLYNIILNQMNINNIQGLINNFTEQEIDQYNEFYDSLNKLYLLINAFYKVISQINLNEAVHKALSENLELDDFVVLEMGKILNNNVDDVVDELIGEHNDILELLEEKIEIIVQNIEREIFKIIDTKEYLLNNVSNEKFLYFLRNEVLNSLDLDVLKIYLDNKRYDVLENVSDEVFCKLSSDQIEDIIKYSELYDMRGLSDKKNSYIVELSNLDTILKYKIDIIYYFYKYITYMSEEQLDYIIKNNALEGIEECNFVLNNVDYVKKIIKNGNYKKIFCYLTVEHVDDDLLNSISFDDIRYFNDKENNLPNLLKNNKIFLKFIQEPYTRVNNIINIVGLENVTREMIMFCILDNNIFGLDFSNEKIKEFSKRTLENIQYAIDCGYKCSKETRLLSTQEVELFIDNNQPEIIDFQYYSVLNIDLIKKAISKGYVYNRSIERYIENIEWSDINYYDELLTIAYSTNNKDYIDSFIINCSFFILNDIDINFINYIYNDPKMMSFISFKRKCSCSLPISTKEDIYEFFNEEGPSDKFYELALQNSTLFEYFKNNYDLLGHFQNNKVLYNYINYIIQTHNFLHFDNKKIYEYFNEDGPSDKFYDIALIDQRYYSDFKNYYNLLNHYQDDKIIINYINYRNKIGVTLESIILDKNDINRCFDERGPKKIFYDIVLFADNSDLYKYVLTDNLDELENIYDSNILSYIYFINKYGKIFEFINKDNVAKFFNQSGPTLELKNYFKNNKEITIKLLNSLVHNDQVIDNLDNDLINIFELYILEGYFNNNKAKYEYLLTYLGPKLLLNLNNDNVLKLIQMDDASLKKIIDTITSCKYDIVPNNMLFDNVIVSLCNFTFKKNNSNIVNVFTNFNSIISRMSLEEIENYFNGTMDTKLQISLDSYVSGIIKITNCSKEELMSAIIECKNLNEDNLRKICRQFLENCERKYLEKHKDLILSYFDIPLSYEKNDSVKKLSNYYKNNLDYFTFNYYRNLFISSLDYNNIKNNMFIETLNMTKNEYDNILSITEEDFNRISVAISEKRKPDDSVKDKFKLFNRFINILSEYKFDNEYEYISSLLHLLEARRISVMKLQKLDMLQILREMDLDIFLKTVVNEPKILESLINTIKNKYIGRLPDQMKNELVSKYKLEFPNSINNIGLFLTKYKQIIERKKRILKAQGIDISIEKINLSFAEILETMSALNSGTEEVRRLFGSQEYNDFLANPAVNSAHFPPKQREEKLVSIADYLYTLDKVAIPSKDTIIEKEDKKINFIVGNRTNSSNICHGERTGACMRVGGVGEGLFLKCLTDKNWFHIRIEDPDTHEYISRVSGFRKGNSVFLNQLRISCIPSKYSNEDLQQFITIYAKSLIEETKDSEYPIENVFINIEYAMKTYKSENNKLYHFGEQIQNCYNLDDVGDLRLYYSSDIWTDVRRDAILLATTVDGKNTKEGYVPFKGGRDDTFIYDAVRDKIYGIEYDESVIKHQFITIDKNLLIEKINRVHAMKEKLLGFDYRYEIEDILFSEDEIIDGYASSDFYVYIDKDYSIHCDYIESIKKDGELISYGQVKQAQEEMNKYVEKLKTKYNITEVRHAIQK